MSEFFMSLIVFLIAAFILGCCIYGAFYCAGAGWTAGSN